MCDIRWRTISAYELIPLLLLSVVSVVSCCHTCMTAGLGRGQSLIPLIWTCQFGDCSSPEQEQQNVLYYVIF